MTDTPCIYCRSKGIVKNGFRRTKNRGKIQLFLCRTCRRSFCKDDGFKWKHYSKEKIIDTLELYVGGGNTSRFLAEFLDLSKNTIIRWALEYSEKVCRFTCKFRPRIMQKVNMDELFLKMMGTFFYVWDAICAENRFAFLFFSPRRRKKDAEELIRQFRNAMMMVFDGAFQYPAVLKAMFGIWWYYHHTHRCKNFEDKKHNNLAERLQNFIRSKTHQRRGFQSLKTGRLQLQLLFAYYNFVRIHSAIGMTPAEKAGLIEYHCENSEKARWRDLIRRASEIGPFHLTLVINRIVGRSQKKALP